MSPETKRCPYCGEEINVNAKKCIHCKEWLDEPSSPVAATTSGRSVASRHEQQVSSAPGPDQIGLQSPMPQQQVIVNQIERKHNSLGTAGFSLALISLLLSGLPVVNWLIWFLGAMFSFIGLFRKPRGLAIAGFVISFIGVIAIILIGGAIWGLLRSWF